MTGCERSSVFGRQNFDNPTSKYHMCKLSDQSETVLLTACYLYTLRRKKDRRKNAMAKNDDRTFCPARQAKFRTSTFFFGLCPMSGAKMNH